MHWPMLETLPEPDRAQLIAACRERRFSRGEVLFHEGDLADSVHLLAEGTAAVSVTTPAGDIVTLSVVGPGATFGEVALVANPPVRSATVTALEACRTFSVHGPVFARVRREYPAVERFLLELFAAEIRRLTTQLVEALYVPAERRVLRRLVDLVSLYDGRAGDLKVPVTQAMLASMAGTTRVTANQALQRAKDRGCVTLSRGNITVIDRARLAQLAG